MPEIRPSELLRQIHRLSIATSRLELTPFEKRELEGAHYALVWVLRYVESAPVDWMLPAPARARVDALLEDLFRPVDQVPELEGAGATFIERSQPRERS